MFATVVTAVAAGHLFAMLGVLASRKAGYSHARHDQRDRGHRGAAPALRRLRPVPARRLAAAGRGRPGPPGESSGGRPGALHRDRYVGAAFFPCDPGSPLSGSARQAAHDLAGAVGYIGGGFALMTIARDLGQPFQLAGLVVLGSAVGLSIVPANAGRGILQRVAEPCLFGCLGLAAWQAVPRADAWFGRAASRSGSTQGIGRLESNRFIGEGR